LQIRRIVREWQDCTYYDHSLLVSLAAILVDKLLERDGAQELDQAKENDRTPERDLAGRRRRRKDDRQKREDK